MYKAMYVLYSAKWWWRKTLANLTNPEQFTKGLAIQIYIIQLQVDSMMNEY